MLRVKALLLLAVTTVAFTMMFAGCSGVTETAPGNGVGTTPPVDTTPPSLPTGLTGAAAGLSAATTYSYTVAARDAAGNISANSASVSITTASAADTTPPSTPTGLTAAAAGSTGANLSWSASTDNVGVTGYIVRRNGVQVATPATTSYADTGLSAATTYSYTVAARDATLSWVASTDNVGVTGYIVRRNGVQVATPATTSFADTGLSAATTYSY